MALVTLALVLPARMLGVVLVLTAPQSTALVLVASLQLALLFMATAKTAMAFMDIIVLPREPLLACRDLPLLLRLMLPACRALLGQMDQVAVLLLCAAPIMARAPMALAFMVPKRVVAGAFKALHPVVVV